MDHKILVRGLLAKDNKPETTIEFANILTPLFDIRASDIVIQNLAAVGQAEVVDQESVTTENIFINVLGGLNNFILDNLHVRNFNHGIIINRDADISKTNQVLKYTNNIVIKNSNLSTFGTTAIAARYVENLFIINNTITNVWGRIKNGSVLAICDGIYLFGVKNALIQNNNISGIRRMGIVLESDVEFLIGFDFTSRLTENIFIIDNTIEELFGGRSSIAVTGDIQTRDPQFNAGIWAEYGKFKPYSILIYNNRIVNSLALNSPNIIHPSEQDSIGIFGSGLALIENDISGFGKAFVGTSSLVLDNQLRNSAGRTQYGELSSTILIMAQKSLADANTVKDKMKNLCNVNQEVCRNAIDAAFSLKGKSSIKGNHFENNNASSIRVISSDGEIKITGNTFSANLFSYSVSASSLDLFDKGEIVIFKAYSDGLLYDISENDFNLTHEFPAVAAIANMGTAYGCRGYIHNNRQMINSSYQYTDSLPIKTYSFGKSSNSSVDVTADSLGAVFSESDRSNGLKLYQYKKISTKKWEKISYVKHVPSGFSIYATNLSSISFSYEGTFIVENSISEINYCRNSPP